MAKFGEEYFISNPNNKIESLDELILPLPKTSISDISENETHISRTNLIKQVFENKARSIVDKQKMKVFAKGSEVTAKGIYTPYEFLHELLPKVYAESNGYNRYVVSDEEAGRIQEESEKLKEELDTEIKNILDEEGADSIYELEPSVIESINKKRKDLENRNLIISESELEAYVLTNPQLTQEHYVEKINRTIPELLEMGLVCYDWNFGNPKYTYKYQYISGNVYQKKTELYINREEITKVIGEDKWQYQEDILNKATPTWARITTAKAFSIYLNAFSHFSQDSALFSVSSSDFVDWENGIYGNSSLASAFKSWVVWAEGQGIVLPKMYGGLTRDEILKVYVDGEKPTIPDYVTDKNTGQTRTLTEDEQKKAIANGREKAQKIGQPLFDLFLNKGLNSTAKQRLEIEWNSKFNCFVLPIMHKTPVALTLSRYFKNDSPFLPNPTQIQSVQFMINAKSGLLAYGVGVGKTASSILNVSYALDNSLCKKPLFVVPLPTYEKWKMEIQGGYITKYIVSYEENGVTSKKVFSEKKKANTFANKNGGKITKQESFSKGLLPHLPPIVDLGNLNWSEYVENNLKEYSDDDYAIMENYQEGIDFVKKMAKKYQRYADERVDDSGGAPQFYGFEEEEDIVRYFPMFQSDEFTRTYNVYQNLFVPKGSKGIIKAGKKTKISPVNFLLYGYSDAKEGIENFGLRDIINQEKYRLGTNKSFPDNTIFIMTYQGLKYIGAENRTTENTYELQNRSSLYAKLYNELSQGEDLVEVLANKPDKLSGMIADELFGNPTKPKIYLNEFGIDYLVVDESHFFKKAFLQAKGTPDKWGDRSYKTGLIKRKSQKYPAIGSTGYPSSRSLLMYILTRFIQHKELEKSKDARGIGGNVCHLTATPFTNSPIEVYSMMALTNIDFLKYAGMFYIEDFFDAFMRIEFAMRFRANKIKKEQVLTGYNNAPQMRGFIYYLMDYKSGQDANIKRPDKYILPNASLGVDTIMRPTDEQAILMRDLKAYIRGKITLEEVCGDISVETPVTEMTDQELLDYIMEQGKESQVQKFSEIDEMDASLRQEAENIVSKLLEKDKEVQQEDLDKREKAIYRFYKGMSFIRQVTLSPYLLQCRKASGTEPTFREYVESSPKLLYSVKCIQSIHQFEDANNIKRTGIVIYMNMGVDPSAKVPVGEPIGQTSEGKPIYGKFETKKWNSGGFEKIKQYLVSVLNYDENDIVIVKGGMSNSNKENAKNKFLSGKATVLIGSSTISTGVDLQNNASSLFLCAFDWNPTDNEQISGRIHRQGNCRSAVRIVYPMISDSVDPLIFQLLQEKTARINEVWDKEGAVSTLNLEDFNPAELQAQLIKDPDDKVEMWYEKENDKINDEIIELEQKLSNLRLSYETFETYETYLPIVRGALTVIDAYKKYKTQQDGIESVKQKIQEITFQTFEDEKDKDGKVIKTSDELMVSAINKVKKDSYDYANDPEGRYIPNDFAEMDADEVAKKLLYDVTRSGSWYRERSWDDLDKMNIFVKERYQSWSEGNWISEEKQSEIEQEKISAEQEQLSASEQLDIANDELEEVRDSIRQATSPEEKIALEERYKNLQAKQKSLSEIYSIKKEVVDRALRILNSLVNGKKLILNKYLPDLGLTWMGSWRDMKQKKKILDSWGLNSENIPQAMAELTQSLSELELRKDNLDREKETKLAEFTEEYLMFQQEAPTIDEMVSAFASVNEKFLGADARLECFEADKTPTVADMPVIPEKQVIDEVDEEEIIEEDEITDSEDKIEQYYETLEGYDILLEIEEDDDVIDQYYDEIEGYLILLEIEGEDVSQLREDYGL